jgi:protein-disulfide isomerase
MASRQAQKEAARQRRVAEEQAARARVQRTRRMQMLGAVLVVVVVAIAAVVIISASGSKNKTVKIGTAAATSTAKTVNSELSGIPQSGTTLGNPNAKITMTEYGDLQCPVCKDFATGPETQLINNEVKSGKVKLVFKSFPTATRELSNWQQIFPLQQDAAYAAGAQGKAWNYILLFYHEQGKEATDYVNAAYLTGLAKQVRGLNMKKWATDRFNPKYSAQVDAEIKAATALNIQGTPGIMFSGPKSQTKLYSGLLPYSSLKQLIKQVS